MLLGSMCSASKQSLALCHLDRNTFTSALYWGGRNERSGMGMDRGVIGVRKERMIEWGRRQGWSKKRERVECAWRNVWNKKNGVERERREV